MLNDQVGLIVVFFLLLKHFVGDFVLQNAFILENRRNYGHPGGLLHAGVHAALTALVFIVAGISPGLLAAFVIGEVVAHYHIDWLKDNIQRKMNLTQDDKGYWILMGLDQLLHQTTYLIMVWIWLGARTPS